jgi:phage terminase large subunit GpA-like protein
MWMYASAREIAAGVAEMVRPPQHVSVSDSACKNLKVVNPSGGGKNMSMSVTPYMREPMDLVRSRLYEAVVFAGPARSGKTLCLVDGVIAYTVVDDPADVLIVQTNQSQAEDYSKTRIARGIFGSPELAKRLSPRAHDDNVLLKFFRSGMALRFGWPSLSQLSGKDIRRVLMTDVDNFSGDLSIDEAFGLALKRCQTYMSAGICVAESSPAKDYIDAGWRKKTAHEAPPAPGILSLYNRGDRRRWYWCCPECKEPFEAAPGIAGFALPDFEDLIDRVMIDDIFVMAEKYSALHCPACEVGIEAKWKKVMNRGGRWVAEGQKMWMDGTVTGERIRSRTASFWLGGVAAAYQPWSSLVERYLQAVKQYALTGSSKPLKTTTNIDQAMPYVPIATRATNNTDELKERAEIWPEQTVPAGVRFLTAQIDVQAGVRPCFVVQVHGVGRNRERWIVDRYAIKSSARPMGDAKDGITSTHTIDPAKYTEDWDRLIEKVINRRYPLNDGSGRSMPIKLVLCDSGGKEGVTQRAYEFWRRLKQMSLHHRFRLVKGAERDGAKTIEETYPDATKSAKRTSGARGDVPVILINVTTLKDVVMADIYRNEPGPGYYHFPVWLKSYFYDELNAETRGAKRWDRVGKQPNETIDLCQYGEAAILALGVEKINWDVPPKWAEVWDKNPDVYIDGLTQPTNTPPPRPVRRMRSSGASVY